jgi:hypothetical protein
MKRLFRGVQLQACVGMGLSGFSILASAMSFEANPPYLYLGGPVVREDWATWQEAMKRFDGQIEYVVMHQSGGGDSQSGRRIGQDIRERRLKTVVLGRCSSACANMFLAGVSRQFGAPVLPAQTVLGYHGSYNKETGKMNERRTGDYFLKMTDGKMTEDFVERFIRLENKQGLMRFVHKDQRRVPEQPLAMLCKGDEDRAKRDEQCERLDDIDALDKGVITTWETLAVPAPKPPTREKVSDAPWRSASSAMPISQTPPPPPALTQ